MRFENYRFRKIFAPGDWMLLYIRGGGHGRATKTVTPPRQHVKEIRIRCIASHPHAQESAMRHVEDVAKNGPCTSKQTQNNNLTTKQRLQLKPSCAALKTSTSRKEKSANRSPESNKVRYVAYKPNLWRRHNQTPTQTRRRTKNSCFCKDFSLKK